MFPTPVACPVLPGASPACPLLSPRSRAPRRQRTCQPSLEFPNPAGRSAHLRPCLVPSPAEATCAPPRPTSASQASQRPAEGPRSNSVRSGPGLHAHHPGLRSLTHVSPPRLKEPHCGALPETAWRSPASFKRRSQSESAPWTRPSLLFETPTSPLPPVCAMTQARRAKSSGSIREPRDSAVSWRGSRGVRKVASLPPACLKPGARRPSELRPQGCAELRRSSEPAMGAGTVPSLSIQGPRL